MTSGVKDRDIVRAVDLVKSYRTGDELIRVLDSVDLVVREGEFVAITGPSGAGKTTLLNCLSGIDDVDAGSITVDGVDLATADDAQRTAQRAASMGFVFQTSELLPVFNALDNVALPMVLTGTPSCEARERSIEVLTRVGLAHRLRHFPAQLSGGEQQRVALARAFAKQPRLVWADEPTGSLDPHTARQIIELLRELQSRGVTLVLVTHDPEIAMFADRCLEVRDGGICAATVA